MRTRIRCSTHLRDESGLTLIELVISSGLGLLVLVLVGSFMISSFSAQQNVQTTADATASAQLAARVIEDGVRQASAVAVVDGDTSESQLLVARTETGIGDHDWECQAWYYDDVAGVIFHTTFQGESFWPWGSDITNWIDLGSGLTEAVDAGEILGDTLDWLFGGDGGAASAQWTVVAVGIRNETGPSGAVEPLFASAGPKSATIRFEVVAGDRTPVLITTTATGRQTDGETDPTCF